MGMDSDVSNMITAVKDDTSATQTIKIK